MQGQASPARDSHPTAKTLGQRGCEETLQDCPAQQEQSSLIPSRSLTSHFSYHVGRKRHFGEELLEEPARLHLGSFQVLLLLLKQEEGTGDIGHHTHRPGNSPSSAYSDLLNPGSLFLSEKGARVSEIAVNYFRNGRQIASEFGLCICSHLSFYFLKFSSNLASLYRNYTIVHLSTTQTALCWVTASTDRTSPATQVKWAQNQILWSINYFYFLICAFKIILSVKKNHCKVTSLLQKQRIKIKTKLCVNAHLNQAKKVRLSNI